MSEPIEVTERLEYLRGEIEGERISTGELIELQGLGESGLIPDGDTLLLQWANVPEFPNDKTFRVEIVVPFIIDEMASKEEAEAYGRYLAESADVLDLGDNKFEVRVLEMEEA